MVEIGVAYHGNVYLDHARADFREMQEHGCNSILFAMSEYDYEQWRGQYFKMARIAKEEFDFTVYINFWAWGRIFGGEAPSVFLSNNAVGRQMFSKDQKAFPAACFNTKSFQKYIHRAIKKVAKVKHIDGFFWDEPHYAYSEENLLPVNLSPHYVCNCGVCQELFFQTYKYKMPIEENEDILEFKENSLLKFLQDLCRTVKKVDMTKKNTICVMPSSANTGLTSWDKVCFGEMDTLATDPYWIVYQRDLEWVRKESEELMRTVRRYDKESQLWLLAFLIPDGRESEIQKVVEIFRQVEVDSIFAWLYRGALQTMIKSKNPPLVWEVIGNAFKKVNENSK